MSNLAASVRRTTRALEAFTAAYNRTQWDRRRLRDDKLQSSPGSALRAAVDAAFPGLPPCMTLGEAERRVAKALAAYDAHRMTDDDA